MKRVWAVILCLALMIPAIGITAPAGVSAFENYGGYVLADIGLRANVGGTHSGGSVVGSAQTFDPIDLTKFGCHPIDGSGRIIEAGKLALQFDTYVVGDDAFRAVLGGVDGQVELTSSGTCDKDELMLWASQVMQFSFGGWKRYTVDLNKFNVPNGGTMDVTKWNYMRIYFSCKGGSGSTYTMKICNVRLVDLTKQAPTEEEDPIGDGTFTADAPVWRVITPPAGYDVDETIVAGYDLKEYVEAHKEDVKVKQCLQKENYAPIIQSLIDGLSEAGGGVLYIPSGHWPCRTEIEVKSGTSIYGDWKKPDGKSKVDGTIIDVYTGKGSVNGSPLIKLAGSSTVQDMTFWYPEQSFTEPTPYTPTVSLGGFTIARNLTFINAYTAVKHGPAFNNCPNATNIYGTPLSAGMDLDCIIDIARFENMNFAADYWINSGLPGSPTSPDDQQALRDHLYYNAVGATMGRIDWSYMTYLNVDGYQSGLVFNVTGAGTPNGQCLNLHFKNCQTGLYVVDVPTTGEMIANSTFENCANGVWLGQMADNVVGDGYLALINCDIDATDYAVRNQQGAMVQVLSSTIRQGLVTSDYGWYNLINTKFETEAPQVYLETGTLSANILGCTNKKGGAITVENEALCPLTHKNQKVDTPAVPTYTDAEVLERNVHVANRQVYLITDLDRTGKTDVTSALQAKLDVAGIHGGIVYLICGNYRLDGSITVPTGVELRGINDVTHYYTKKSTSIEVYSTKTTDPAIILQEGSGLRALDIWYPEQGRNNDYLWYEKYTKYPYTIQGRGKDIYVVNVGLCNAWDGLDLMTYRCDNHYVEYLAGYPYHNFIAVGGGSKNGTLRNFHVNPASLMWTALDDTASFELNMYKQTQNYAPVCIVGDAENEMLYDCFNYGGYAGIQFVAEDSGAATARVIGCAMDYTTVCLDVQAVEKLDVLNLQMVAYNFKLGSALKKEMFHIQLGADNKGTVNVSGCLFWADPTLCVNVQGGTLNINGLNYFTTGSDFARVSANGAINVYGGYFKRSKVVVLASSNHDRIRLIGGYYNKLPSGASQVGEFTDMMYRTLRWDVPQSKADVSDTVLFTESFTAPTDNITFTKGVSGNASVKYVSGVAVLNAGTTSSVVLTGNTSNGGIASTKNVMKDKQYRVAFRTKIDKLPDGNQFMFILSTSDDDVITPIVFTNGKINDGKNNLTSFKTDTWYRVAVDVDMVAGTYKVTVKDDNGRLVALGDEKVLPQGAYIKNVSFACNAAPAAATVDDAAQVEIDYVYATYEDGLLGDVDGDGDITSTDARLVLQYYAKKIDGSALNIAVADVDGDGDITSTDARLILQYYAKKIDHFPV